MVTPSSHINKFISEQIKDVRELQLEAFDIAGEIAVKNQTLAHKYKNQTGNLSSSIGFLVLDDGRVYSRGGFEKTPSADGEAIDGAQGIKDGKEFIESLSNQYPNGQVLIVVAGMEYAVHVEKMGLDALTTAELIAEKTVNKLLKVIK